MSGSFDQILRIKIMKNNLGTNLMPQLFGLWHEYVIIESNNYFWSFEKDKEGLYVQRSSSEAAVTNLLFGHRRKGDPQPEDRGEKQGRDRIIDVIHWIHGGRHLSQGTFHIFQNNCHYFASELYKRFSWIENKSEIYTQYLSLIKIPTNDLNFRNKLISKLKKT